MDNKVDYFAQNVEKLRKLIDPKGFGIHRDAEPVVIKVYCRIKMQDRDEYDFFCLNGYDDDLIESMTDEDRKWLGKFVTTGDFNSMTEEKITGIKKE